ncbi:MAG: hypothetical protein Q7T11_06455, partial [Deltaproteobacteria bacterium]|nr:hypothetical protein [Deltaproteobacteria bacterium]
DRNTNSNMTNRMVNQAITEGNVQTPSCTPGTVCNQSNVNQSNANHGARVNELERRRQAQGNPPTPPASGDPGPDGIDTCTAEGRRAQATMDCVEQAAFVKYMEQMGGIGPDGNPLGPVVNPGEGGEPVVGFDIPGLACFMGQTPDKTDYNGPAGATDNCMYGDDPTCFQTTGSAMTDMAPFFTDSCMNPLDPTCNDNICPDGQEAVFGIGGITCQPAAPIGTGGPTGPNPGGDPE